MIDVDILKDLPIFQAESCAAQKVHDLIVLDHKLPDKALASKCLLQEAALFPCACGKRAKADQQQVVDVKVEKTRGGILSTGETAPSCVRVGGRLKCLVCNDIHKMAQVVAVSEFCFDQIQD